MTFFKMLLFLILGLGVFTKSKLNHGIKDVDNNSSCRNVVAEYVASTPGDQALIKSYLHIPKELVSDFIRWDLKLNQDHQFELALNYGESKPNTLGFMNDGIKVSYRGKYTQVHSPSIKRDILKFISNDQAIHFNLLPLNDQLMHMLNDKEQLMVGNGGWSFTLNKKSALNAKDTHLPILHHHSSEITPSVQVTYDGRTPSAGLAQDYKFQINSESFKLKWRIVLNRDANTLMPTTYKLRNIINNEPNDITGTWKEIHGTSDNPDVLVYQLNFNQPEKTMRLLVLDENILFFLDKQDRPYVGNKDFSFTLNRKI